MKRNHFLFIFGIFISCFFVFQPTFLEAQEKLPPNNLDEAYTQYRQAYDEYQVAHAAYKLAQSRAQTYGTLVSQTEALEKTKTFMTARDNVLISYADILSFANTNPSLTQIIIQQKQFFADHQKTIPALSTTPDTITSSLVITRQYPLVEQLNQQVLVGIFLSRFEESVTTFDALETKMQQLLTTLKQQENDTVTLDTWFNDAENKLLLAHTYLDTARRIKTQNGGLQQLQSALFTSQQYYKEAIAIYEEMLREVKYGNY